MLSPKIVHRTHRNYFYKYCCVMENITASMVNVQKLLCGKCADGQIMIRCPFENP